MRNFLIITSVELEMLVFACDSSSNNFSSKFGSHGIVVTGEDTCPRVHEFETQQVYDSHLFLVKLSSGV